MERWNSIESIAASLGGAALQPNFVRLEPRCEDPEGEYSSHSNH